MCRYSGKVCEEKVFSSSSALGDRLVLLHCRFANEKIGTQSNLPNVRQKVNKCQPESGLKPQLFEFKFNAFPTKPQLVF